MAVRIICDVLIALCRVRLHALVCFSVLGSRVSHIVLFRFVLVLVPHLVFCCCCCLFCSTTFCVCVFKAIFVLELFLKF